MTTLHHVLAGKGDGIFDTTRDATVHDALSLMAKKNIGALMVREAGRLVGIFTERGFARKVFLAGKTSPLTKVGDVMDQKVIVGRPETTVEEALALMASKGIRHLPVCSAEEVVGMVTMTDLVKSLVGEREFTLKQMQDYMYR